MRRFLQIVLLIVFCTNVSISQSCFPNGITFLSQSDLDLFPYLYPDCTTIEGDLIINSENITNVDSLYNITKVEGKLEIYDTQISDLCGLSNLDTVNYGITIGWSHNLTNLEGLNSLKAFGCYANGSECEGATFRVYWCNGMTDLSGLESLKDFGSLYLQNNESLTSIEGLDSITTAGNIRIEQCDALQSLSGIETLEELGYLKLWFCDSITGLTSMPNVTTMQEIEIHGNPLLQSLEGLDSLMLFETGMYSYPEIKIIDNENLSDISAIGNADLSNVQTLEIEENSMLGVCSYPSICNYIDSDKDVTIRNNMPGCNGIVELVGLCCVQDTMWCPPQTKICFENGIEFGSQSDIDAFPGTYPNCTTIGGNLRITSNDITSVDSLYNITKVMGELNIYQTNLSDLNGLHNLDTVYYGVTVGWSHILSNLEGLNSLKAFGCYANGEDCEGATFRVYWCNGMTDLSGLESLKDYGSLYLQNNESLTSLEGLDSITTAGNIRIEQCDALQSLSGIETLEELGYLKLWFCDSITGLTSMPNVTTMQEIEIHGNPLLQSLEGLDSLMLFETGMYNYPEIAIIDNESLSDISAIGNADLSNVEKLEITENTSLGICGYPAICDYLENYQNPYTEIGGNSLGCNGLLELEKDCNNQLSIFEVETSTASFQGNNTTHYWHDPNNWRNNMVPTDSSFVIIQSFMECVVQQDSIAECRELELQPNSEIRCQEDSELRIYGNQ